MGLVATVPNTTMHYYKIYGLKAAADIQLQQHTSDLLRTINYPLFYTSPLKICYQQLQNDATANLSILTSDPTFATGESNTTTAKTIKLLHEHSITLHNNNIQWPFPLPQAGTTINLILNNLSRSVRLKHNLNKYGLYFVEQFTNNSYTAFLTWRQVHHTIQKIPRKRAPGWFTKLTDEIVAATSIHNHLIMLNPFTLPVFNSTKSPWIYHIPKNTFGKHSKTSNGKIIYRHWTLSPVTPGKIIKCKGCPETQKGKSTCYITAPVSMITNLQVDRQKHIHTNISDLQSALRNLNPSDTSPIIFTGHLFHKDVSPNE
ncbi:hypothetical protein C2G38_2031902 [Gigaspora rosea]|uniref:Uncharacterized protein n=1 Tax=Gigaspora rosea TaxID=44941 RepID=A0A397VPG6_9GLOM|nr:hypothetical protein C2G38_2031902 [Gigaspora rosea]